MESGGGMATGGTRFMNESAFTSVHLTSWSFLIYLLLTFMFLRANDVAGQDSRREIDFTIVGESFVAIQVQDDSASADWYQTVFGLNLVNRLQADDGRYSIRILTRRGLTIELIRMRDVTASNGDAHLGLFKAGFYVNDIDRVFQWLQHYNVNIDGTIVTDSALEVRTFVFRDPDGNRWQVFQRCGRTCR